MSTDRYTRRAWLQAAGALAASMALAACGQASGVVGSAASTSSARTTSGQAATTAASSASTSVAAPSTTVSAGAASAAPPTPTSAPSTATPTSSASAAAASATPISSTAATSVAPATTATTASGAATTSASAAAARGVKLTIDASGTVASYQVQEQLAGHDFPSQAVGKTSAVTGAIVLDASGKIAVGDSKIALDLRTLKSDQGMRDNYIQHDPLDTAQYPMANFVPSAATGLPWPLPSTGTAKFDLAGDMTVHGTTKPMTWAVTATFAADKVTGTATTPFTFTEFGMQPPRTMIALSVHDGGTLNLQFSAARAAQ